MIYERYRYKNVFWEWRRSHGIYVSDLRSGDEVEAFLPQLYAVCDYLNERHPQDETNCEYHMPKVRESGGADGGRKAFRDADAVKRQMVSMKEHAQEMARTFSESQKEQNKNPIVTIITVIAGILALLMSISD